ncbi:MAG: ABC transporter permease [Christensenellales bacterium]|jgi:peptide/nickel transport system permease protein
MKRDMTDPKNIREEDLNDLNKTLNAPEIDENPPGDIPQKALDDSRRVKVLSPGMLVFKRFMRSKLAIAGSIILIFMFAFAFLGGLISPYKQEEVFHKYDQMELDFAQATVRTAFSPTTVDDAVAVDSSVKASINTEIKKMAEDETTRKITDKNGSDYILTKKNVALYTLEKIEYNTVATYDIMPKTYNFTDPQYNEPGFIAAVNALDPSGIPTETPAFFTYGDAKFRVSRVLKTCTIAKATEPMLALYTTTYVFDLYDESIQPDNELKYLSLASMSGGNEFTYNGVDYITVESEDVVGLFTVYEKAEDPPVVDPEPEAEAEGGEEGGETDAIPAVNYGIPKFNISSFVVRRYTGEDTLPINYKLELQNFVAGMVEGSLQTGEFTYVEETEHGPITNIFKVQRRLDNFVVRNNRTTYLIDIFAKPSAEHWLGTDANGMDVITRMMYGGRISLLIGFIVIFLETILGVIMGGIAGYFGKWVDNLIMRIVDIFNCIPFLPIMIILGSVFDKLQLGSYERIMWLMILMGVLGWPGIARLVRGQILSLREQEFMLAAEASGISAKRRIFRHLVPNVMPQLIVNATMGLGGIIITESTLSFLGLGAKYPLATWGSMINSVSDASSLVNYTYIWIPVGVLICLTVIAFNFVGDGLRDAFDPKMKR